MDAEGGGQRSLRAGSHLAGRFLEEDARNAALDSKE
jgi:hypothetical protein